jgi:hypothetical protein
VADIPLVAVSASITASTIADTSHQDASPFLFRPHCPDRGDALMPDIIERSLPDVNG